MERFKIAVVGLHFGRVIVEELLQGPSRGHFELAAGCDIDHAIADMQAARYGIPVCYDMEELLGRKDIAAIGLFTPPGGRAALIRKIIHSGKHVMTTKPFEHDPAAAAAILEEARKLRRAVHLNSPAPVVPPDVAQVLDWRDRFDLGKPVGGRADIWAPRNEKADGRWYDDPRKCPAAPVYRIGIYLINHLVQFLGPASKVQVLHSRIRTGRPTPDNAQVSVLFQNGALGCVYASFCVDDAQDHRNFVTLNFERGTVYYNVDPRGGPAAAGRVRLTLVPAGGRIETAELAAAGGYQWENFYSAVAGKYEAPPEYDRTIVEGLRVLSAVGRAYASGATEAVGE